MGNSQIIFLKTNAIEKRPEVHGQMTMYQMIDLAANVTFLQLEQGKVAIFIANGQLQQTSIVRRLTKTERGIYFETEYASYVQRFNEPALPFGA